METERRRRQIALSTLGSGVIVFGAWSILKTLLYLWVTPSAAALPDDISPEFAHAAKIILNMMVGCFLAADMGLRLYLGLSARAESRGRRKSAVYIVLGAVMLLVNLYVMFYTLLNIGQLRLEKQSEIDYYVSLFVDTTSTAMLAELLYNAVRLRQLEKKQEG